MLEMEALQGKTTCF